MNVKKVLTSEYRNLAKDNEYYLWSFLQREQNTSNLFFWSLLDDKVNPKTKVENQLIDFLEVFPLNIYESYVDESIDFLNGFGINTNLLYRIPEDHGISIFRERKLFYKPLIILFKKYQFVDSTFNHCYCTEGLTEMVISNIPEIGKNLKFD